MSWLDSIKEWLTQPAKPGELSNAFSLGYNGGGVLISQADRVHQETQKKRTNALDDSGSKWTPYYFQGLSGLTAAQREEWEKDAYDDIEGVKKRHPYATEDEYNQYLDNVFKNNILKESKNKKVQDIFKGGNLTEEEWDTLDMNIARAAMEDDVDGLSDEKDNYRQDALAHWGDWFTGSTIDDTIREGARKYIEDSKTEDDVSGIVNLLNEDPTKKEQALNMLDSLSKELSTDYGIANDKAMGIGMQDYGKYKDTEVLKMGEEERKRLYANYVLDYQRGGQKYANENLVNYYKDKMEAGQSKLDVAVNVGATFLDSMASMGIGALGLLDGLMTGGSIGRTIFGESEEDTQRREGQSYFQDIFDNPLVQYSNDLMETHVYDMDAQKTFKEAGISDNSIYEGSDEEGKLLNAKTLPNLLGQYGFTAATTVMSFGGTAAAQGAVKGALWLSKGLGMAKNVTAWNKALKAAAKSKDMLNLVNSGIIATTEGAQIAQADKVDSFSNMREDLYNMYLRQYIEEDPERAANLITALNGDPSQTPAGTLVPDGKDKKSYHKEYSSKDVDAMTKVLAGNKEVKEGLIQKYMKEHADEAQNDLDNIRAIAEDAAVADFAAQSLINGIVNMGLKSTLHSEGVQKALQHVGLKKKPSIMDNVDLERSAEGTWRATAKRASKWNLVKERAKEALGEGLEEYEQDVASGFGEGYGDVAYKQYLDAKYKDDKGVSTAVEYSMVDALGGALQQAGKKAVGMESTKDGIYGALSAAIGGFNVNQRWNAGKSQGEGNAGWFARISDMSPITWRSTFTPLINGTEARIQQSYNDRTAESLNKFFSDKATQDKLLNAEGTMNFIRDYQDALQGKDELKARDAQLGQQFSVVNTLISLKGTAYYDAVMTSLNGREALGDMTDAQISEQLNDASSDASRVLREMKGELTNKTGDSSRDHDFSGTAENVEMVKKAAKNAHDMKETLADAEQQRQQVLKDFGGNLDEDGISALVYQNLAIKDKKKRMDAIDKDLQEVINFDTDAQKGKASKEATSKYGNLASLQEDIAHLENQKKEADETLAEAKKEYDDVLAREKEKGYKPSSEDVAIKQGYEFLKAMSEQLDQAVSKARKEEKALNKVVQRVIKAKENGMDEEVMEAPVLSEKEIMELGATERAIMLNPKNKEKFSEAQQRVIDDLNSKGVQKYGKDWQNKLRDRSRLESQRMKEIKMQNQLMSSTNALGDYLSHVRLDKAVRMRTDQYEQLFKDATKIIKESNKTGVLDVNQLRALEKVANFLFSPSEDALTDQAKKILFQKYENTPMMRILNERIDDVDKMSSFLKMTDIVQHTEKVYKSTGGTDPATGEAVPILEEETYDREISEDDRRYLGYALDFAVQKGIGLNDLPQRVTDPDFAAYMAERLKQDNIMPQNDLERAAAPSIVSDLLKDVLNAYRYDQKIQEEVRKPKETSGKPTSVVNDPVEPKGEKQGSKKTQGRNEGDRRPDEVKDIHNPLGIPTSPQPAPATTPTPAASPTSEPADSPITTGNTLASGSGEDNVGEATDGRTQEAQPGSNEEILEDEDIQTINGNILGGIRTLLDTLNGMQMPDVTRNRIKEIIKSLASSRSFPSIGSLQSTLMREGITANSTLYPQIKQKLMALGTKTIEEDRQETPTYGGQSDSSLDRPVPFALESMDLDFFLNTPGYEVFADYIKEHGMVPFIQKLGERLKENADKTRKDNPLVFIYDPQLAGRVQESMKKSGKTYTELDAPVVMAIRVTDESKLSEEEKSRLIEVPNVYGYSSEENVKYMPIGFLPANNNQHIPTSKWAGGIRSRIDYNFKESDKPQLLRYPTANPKGKQNGTVITTNIQTIEAHTEEESIPHSGEQVPISSVESLMEANAMSPSEALVHATEDEIAEYRKAREEGDRKALRRTKLWKAMRLAFIKKLRKDRKQAADPDDPEPKRLVFNIAKGGRDVFGKPVLIRRISETLDRNTGRLIVDELADANDDNAKEVIAGNSRFERLFKVWKKLKGNDGFEDLKGLFGPDGQMVNQSAYDDALSKFEAAMEQDLLNNLYVDNCSVAAKIVGSGTDRKVRIQVKSGDEVLSTLETKFNGPLFENEYVDFLKHLILDEENKTRPGVNNPRYERVKWQVNYQNAATSNDRNASAAQRKYATDDLADAYDDGILEMQVTKVAYPASRVTASMGPSMRKLYETEPAKPEQKPASPTETRAAHESEGKNGELVDGNSGTVTRPMNAEGIKASIPPIIRQAVSRIIEDSRSRTVTDDGKHYSIAGQLWARVTSIKTALEGGGDRFNPESGWALPSTKIGNSFDIFGRDVFNGKFDGMTPEERKEAFEDYDNSVPENYEEVYQALKAFQVRLLGKDQVIIPVPSSMRDGVEQEGHITAKGVLEVKVNNNDTVETRHVRVAGTLDVLAIDKNGNLHIYDFKTHHSRLFTREGAEKKGYDRQLSMYARFLEEEYGLRVKSINILPCYVHYDTPSGVDNSNNPIGHPEKDYKEERQGTNQLLYRDAQTDKPWVQFHDAKFRVEPEFSLTMLSGDKLVASFDRMSEDEKAALVEQIQDQSDTPGEEIAGSDDIVSGKPVVEDASDGYEEDEGYSFEGDGLEEGEDTSDEDTLGDLDNALGRRTPLQDQAGACGTKLE